MLDIDVAVELDVRHLLVVQLVDIAVVLRCSSLSDDRLLLGFFFFLGLRHLHIPLLNNFFVILDHDTLYGHSLWLFRSMIWLLIHQHPLEAIIELVEVVGHLVQVLRDEELVLEGLHICRLLDV